MKDFTLSAKDKKAARDGETFILTDKATGTQYIITPYIIQHARAQLAAGAGVISGLPEVLGENRMEEVRITL
jgi:hypothetical protein